MREIRFRAWDIENKVMCDVSHIFIANMVLPQTVMASVGSEMKHCPSDAILMQFTGLLDRHSKEIFEGDILKWTNHTKCCNVATWDCLCEVVWESCGFYRRDILDGTLYGWANIKNEQVEVIGNIYEHPEMLKEPYAYNQD